MGKKRRRARRTEPEEELEEDREIPEGTKRGIAIVLLSLAVFLSVASLFGKAGFLGSVIAKSLHLLFGVGSWFVLVVLVVLVVMLLRARAWRLRSINYIGVVLFVAAWLGLAHMLVDGAPLAAAWAGDGGGLVGFVMRIGFERIAGFWAAVVILLSLSVIAILLFFEMSLEDLAVHRWFTRSRSSEDVGEDDPEEEGASPGIVVEEVKEEAPGVGSAIRGVAASIKNGVSGRDIPALLGKRHPGGLKRVAQFPLEILEVDTEEPSSGDIEAIMERIEKTLSQFGIPVEMGEVNVGPTVTQYTFKPSEGVKLSKITSLNADLALALAAHPIRIEAPIPGKSLVGIEVPNQRVARVTLRSILESKEFKQGSSTTVALGRDVGGLPWVADVAAMPHLLVAGSTGSGKSVCLHNLISSLLYQNSPDQLRFIMVDPKRVELSIYNGIPHLMTPVIVDTKKTINALKWAILEMERRFDLLSATNKRDIGTYNAEMEEIMPYLVIVIDELADLMATAAGEVEGAIIRLAQMARAVGIHLIVATQRPSVNVITGLIKANITTRIAFAVASQVDSRTIIDQSGAEKLLGRGDMLFVSAELSKPKRLQGAFISSGEIKKITSHLKEHAESVAYDVSITDRGGSTNINGGGSYDDEDELFEQARSLVTNERKASASYLQRRLKVGYARAARLMDLMEQAGVVGPQDGAKPRDILVSRDVANATPSVPEFGVEDMIESDEVESSPSNEFEDEYTQEGGDEEDEKDNPL
ncbi:MAG: DNA translocase FtsK 4TM domain-containing protein [bacterium]|nr:DNA translocase FtsK 4TM domain-containing protein [bacterium]